MLNHGHQNYFRKETMEKKIRTYLRPSSLGSYFGVGYNDPKTQYKIDTGELVEEFDEDAKARLALGAYLEDSALDFFADKFKIIINRRNDQIYEIYDGKLRGKIDGMTWLNGEETVVEMKISNSKSEPFTNRMGYIIQTHCYMMATGTRQALLCGLQNGEPRYRIVYYSQQIVDDIKQMTDFILAMMRGEKTWDDYPTEILERYSRQKLLPSIDTMTNDEEDLVIKLARLRSQKSAIEREIDTINETIIEQYGEGVYEKDGLKVIITPVEGRVSYDWAALSMDHPELDMSKYIRRSADYKQIRVTNKRK